MKMREEIICAGFGGQGIMLMGKVLARAALAGGRHVTWMPSYGAEVRGGTAHCMIIVSKEEIASPVVTLPDVAIVMNMPSLRKFAGSVKPGGLLIINSSLADESVGKNDFDVMKVPATEIARELGSDKTSNMVILGAYAARSGAFTLKQIEQSLKDMLPSHHQDLFQLNQKALKKGAKFAK